jgi:hypothetical protein
MEKIPKYASFETEIDVKIKILQHCIALRGIVSEATHRRLRRGSG